MRNHFTKRPFGWYQNAVFSIIAQLFKRGNLELRQDANILEGDDALNAFMNSSNYANTLLEPQKEIEPRLVNQLKSLYTDAFDESCVVSEAKEVAIDFKKRLKEMSVEVSQLMSKRHEYKFLKNLEPLSDLLSRL